LLVALLSPLFAAIALLLALTQGRDLLYRGERLGKDRVPFQIYKFRTLRSGADSVTPPEGLIGTTGLETRFGRYLRETRLDELPQLFNVLKGDMNLMGPRPVRAATAATFAARLAGYETRFSVRPGLVGYTQALMTHDTPKEIRQRFNLLICRRPACIRLELLFLAHTALAIAAHTSAVCFRRLTRAHGETRTERRKRARTRPNNAVAIMRHSGNVIGCGYIVDINEGTFVFASPIALPSGRFSFRLICPVHFCGRRSATCDGVCREVFRKTRETRRWRGDFFYLVTYAPSSALSHYVIDRYFLRNSVVFDTGRWLRRSLARAWLPELIGAGCALAALLIGSVQAAGETYVRPFAQDALWNVPASQLVRHAQSSELARRLWFEAPSRPGDFNLSFEEYTYPVYDARQATGTYPVLTDRPGNLSGSVIPWNPAWSPAQGTDAQVIVLDPPTGREWDLWQTRFDGRAVRATNGNLVPGDYRTKADGFFPSRGCGIQYLAMLVRPQEIAKGAIEHALSMPVRNIDGNGFVPPATKLERDHGVVGIPLGTRFALKSSLEELEQWVDSLPAQLPVQTRNSARIIARALRDSGWIITDTSGGAHLQFESRLTAGEGWASLGLERMTVQGKEYPRDLLDGLFKPERIYALEPAPPRLTQK
jgi:lipopolysaccharide/colanic/teichoic acid biosynthesis glycosyltransferase